MNQAVIYKQIGWKRCVACSDSKLKPGWMWVGRNDWILCPSCNGTAQEPVYRVLDPLTGAEIDYENFRCISGGQSAIL